MPRDWNSHSLSGLEDENMNFAHERKPTGTGRRTAGCGVNLGISGPRTTYERGRSMRMPLSRVWEKPCTKVKIDYDIERGEMGRKIAVATARKVCRRCSLPIYLKFSVSDSLYDHLVHTQLSVSIREPGLDTSLGTSELCRDQKNTLINEGVRSIAYLWFSGVTMTI